MTKPLRFKSGSFLIALAIAYPFGAAAETGVKFGVVTQDRNLPVTIDADQLKVDQETNIAIFTGHVEAEQGVLKLRAPKILVKSITDSKQISKIIASGGVILESAVETASSDNAIYDMVTGLIEMTGNVILKKGTTTIAGPKFIVDVNNGTGMMQGRVKSVFSASSQ